MNFPVYIAVFVICAAPLVYGMYLSLHVDHKIRARGYLFTGLGFVAQTIANALGHYPVTASAAAVAAAVYLYMWWNGGGGDGLKRRLKSWTASFGRMTAPQTA